MEKISRKVLRQMGFFKECQGLIDRYINVESAWEEHLKHSQNFIRKATSGKKINNLAVLGSGWLLDLPLEELASQAEHVWLYDVVHPPQVLHKLHAYLNVTTLSADITGGAIMNTWEAVKEYKKTKRKIAPEIICNTEFHPDPPADYTISLNTLSQTGVMITGYLQQHAPYNKEEIEFINTSLQQSHLQLLVPGKSCLITDIKEMGFDFSNRLKETIELINIALPSSDRVETWDWQFDPAGGYKSDTKTILKVLAMEIQDQIV